MLGPVWPNLLNVVDNYFDVLTALLHNDAQNLRDLIIEYELLVVADEFKEKFGLFVRHSGDMTHCNDF